MLMRSNSTEHKLKPAKTQNRRQEGNIMTTDTAFTRELKLLCAISEQIDKMHENPDEAEPYDKTLAEVETAMQKYIYDQNEAEALHAVASCIRKSYKAILLSGPNK